MNDDLMFVDEDLKEVPKITQSQLEEILSRYANHEDTEQDEEDLVLYVIQEMISQGKTYFDKNEISQRTGDLRSGYIMRQLAEHGLVEPMIDADGNDSYEVTPLGEQIYKELSQEST